MEIANNVQLVKESCEISSDKLERTVRVDYYLPTNVPEPGRMSLLLINDGQDMKTLGLEPMLNELLEKQLIDPILCIGIHAGVKRKMEYGTANVPDYKGRGADAKKYGSFIFEELLPFSKKKYGVAEFKEKAFAGFSLGALSAMDIVWNYPMEFSRVGLFSGSFWWRTKDQNDPGYSDENDRIIHAEVRNGGYYPWLKFFFECGGADEAQDRNNNGIIDSIDDTLDLISELVNKGYDRENDIYYLLLEDGKHDVPTWGRAMPAFLEWGWGKKKQLPTGE